MPGLLSFGLNILADVFYPKYCFGCQRPGSYLCKFCMSQIPFQRKNYCVVCNSPNTGGFTHPSCLNNNHPDRLLSAFSYYNRVIADMVITGKYYFVPEVFAILGALTAEYLLQQNNFTDFVVCAVPLHPRRQRWRGFNQSEVAAKVIAQGLRLPYYPLLQRTKNTQTQKNLDAQGRKSNIKSAFRTPPYFKHIPKKVLLIDDVSTTGQTLLEASRALKQAGVQIVWCISIAKD